MKSGLPTNLQCNSNFQDQTARVTKEISALFQVEDAYKSVDAS